MFGAIVTHRLNRHSAYRAVRWVQEPSRATAYCSVDAETPRWSVATVSLTARRSVERSSAPLCMAYAVALALVLPWFSYAPPRD